jgi:hypothetical protein
MVWGPWHWYLYYGDERILKEHYPAMKKYVDFLSRSAKDGVQDWGLKDWLAVVDTPRPLVNTPAHYLYTILVSRAAGILGLTEDARAYTRSAEEIRENFNRRFLDPQTGIYRIPAKPSAPGPAKPGKARAKEATGCTQAAQALALGVGLAPDPIRPAIAKALLDDLSGRDFFLTTGFVSTPYLLDVLAEIDPQAGYRTTSNRGKPSWYFMTAGTDNDLQKENWGGGQALMPSLGGSIAKWFFRGLAGLWPDPAGPGFKKFLVRPNPVGDIHWVQADYDSVQGRIAIHWRRRGQVFSLDLTVPANTTATVWIPARAAEEVKESGVPAGQAAGVKFLRQEGQKALFEVEAGLYRFSTLLPPQDKEKA